MNTEMTWTEAQDLLDGYPDVLGRPEYEAACAALGAQIMPDVSCNSYGVCNGWFAPPDYPVAHCVKMALAKRRQRGMEAESAARLVAPRPAAPMVRCDCGHSVVPVLVMNASRGTSCPDCYDRMSD